LFLFRAPPFSRLPIPENSSGGVISGKGAEVYATSSQDPPPVFSESSIFFPFAFFSEDVSLFRHAMAPSLLLLNKTKWWGGFPSPLFPQIGILLPDGFEPFFWFLGIIEGCIVPFSKKGPRASSSVPSSFCSITSALGIGVRRAFLSPYLRDGDPPLLYSEACPPPEIMGRGHSSPDCLPPLSELFFLFRSPLSFLAVIFLFFSPKPRRSRAL